MGLSTQVARKIDVWNVTDLAWCAAVGTSRERGSRACIPAARPASTPLGASSHALANRGRTTKHRRHLEDEDCISCWHPIEKAGSIAKNLWIGLGFADLPVSERKLKANGLAVLQSSHVLPGPPLQRDA